MRRKLRVFGRGIKNFFNPRNGKAWSKGLKTASVAMVLVLVIVLVLSLTVLRSERVVIVEVEDETCQEALLACQKKSAEDDQVIAALQQQIIELTTPSTITIEKWVRLDGSCVWQKEVSAEKGDWLEMKLVVNITQTIEHVWVKDVSLAEDPWIRVEDLRIDGERFSGDITTGIALGRLTDESREITFRALLSNGKSNYSCGVNILDNMAQAGDCGFQASASARILVDIDCSSSSCCRPKPPCTECPDPIPPPPPPEEDGGPAPRPDPDD